MFQRILIATDGSKHSEQAAAIGVELARLSEGKVWAIYVADTGKYIPVGGLVPPFGDVNPYVMDETVIGLRDFILEEGKKATDKVAEMAEKGGVSCEKSIVEGHPASEIMQVAEEEKMDLIVMGSIGKTGLEKILLGSVAEKVVRNSKTPVLLIPIG
jgi:nucleotide-binding universal stress UspA family protein